MPRTWGRWKRTAAAAALFAALQLVPVERSNPPVAFDLPSPPPVKEILARSCYDCHSHETDWPWYAWVAPASWLVAYDVSGARSELNFSTWRGYRLDKRARLLEDVLEEVDEGHMPPWHYLLLHPKARLSDSERETLRRWIHEAPE
jgi:heme-binding protein